MISILRSLSNYLYPPILQVSAPPQQPEAFCDQHIAAYFSKTECLEECIKNCCENALSDLADEECGPSRELELKVQALLQSFSARVDQATKLDFEACVSLETAFEKALSEGIVEKWAKFKAKQLYEISILEVDESFRKAALVSWVNDVFETRHSFNDASPSAISKFIKKINGVFSSYEESAKKEKMKAILYGRKGYNSLVFVDLTDKSESGAFNSIATKEFVNELLRQKWEIYFPKKIPVKASNP